MEADMTDRREHKVMKYIPDVSLGNILVIITIVGGLFGVWGTYSRDQEKQDNRIQALEDNKKEVNNKLDRITTGMEALNEKVNTVNTNIAVLKATTGEPKK